MQTGARPAASDPSPVVGASPRPPFQSGDSFGAGWQAERLIHTGPVFEVWRARGANATRAAVKVPSRRARDREAAREVLRGEHACLVAIRHAHIVASLGLVDEPGHTALVTPWQSGGDMVSLAGSAPRHWLGPLGELASALAHVHARGFVHRDVKARNVMFDAHGRVRLIDFGSAAPHGARVGHGGVTAAHRPPEAARTVAMCDDDHYALAALIYELATGRLPRGPDGRGRLLEAVPASDDANADRALDWAFAWLEPDRRPRAGNIASLAAVMNATEFA